MTNKTVLILGATGTTGRRLAGRLTATGVTVRAASRQPAPDRVLFGWDRPDTHAPALADVDAVYLVPPAFVDDPTPVTGPFLQAAKRAGVSRLVAISSLGVTFPGEPEDSGRRRLEAQIHESGLDWTILRPTGFAQNFSEGFLAPGILQADTIITASGHGAVSFVDADDIAALAAIALTQPGHAQATYPVTGPEALTFAQAAEIIGHAAGRAITHHDVPEEQMRGMLADAGVPADYAAMLLRDMHATREGHSAQISHTIPQLTGQPATTFHDYATQAAAAWHTDLTPSSMTA